VIAAAVRKQVTGARFLRRRDYDGQRRGVINADRDPVAEAWIFVAGGLLATIDGRLGGLLGDDLLGAGFTAGLDAGSAEPLPKPGSSKTVARGRNVKAPAAARGSPNQAGAGWATPTRLCGQTRRSMPPALLPT
jgi:hypothetical protein